MEYKIIKGKRRAIASYGRYVARVVHRQTVTYDDFARELAREAGTAKVSDMHAVMGKVLRILNRHLMQGDIVEIPYIGRMKLEAISASMDDASDFDPVRHIKGHRVRLIPNKERPTPLTPSRPTPLTPSR